MGALGSAVPARFMPGAPRNPGEIPMIPATYSATGIRIPPGSLDRWFAARRRHATEVVEVAVFGDSTLAGQTLTGANYSPITRLRALFAGDGYVDGGHGHLNGINDDAAASGGAESLVLGQGFNQQNIYVLPGESSYGDVSGDNQTFTRIGRYLTLYYSRFNSGGRFTYEIDSSGTEVPVDPALPASGSANTFDKVYIDLGTDATHTIKIRNKGGRLLVAPAYTGGTATGTGSGGSLAAGTYDYAAALVTSGGAIGPLGPTITVTITTGQTYGLTLAAQPEGATTTTNLYRRVSGVGAFKLIASVATNIGSPYLVANDTGLTAGVDYAAGAAPVLNSANKWVNVSTVVTRGAGIVLNNWAGRGQTSGGVATPYTLALALGLDMEPIGSVAATSRAIDSSPGARNPILTIFGHGINDQQQSPSDNSATLKSNTITGIRAARYAGSDALVLIPAFEAAANQSNAALYRTALQQAADEEGAARIDVGMGGALPGLIAGITTNPHLTQAQYTTQGDFDYSVIGAR